MFLFLWICIINLAWFTDLSQISGSLYMLMRSSLFILRRKQFTFNVSWDGVGTTTEVNKSVASYGPLPKFMAFPINLYC